MKSLRNRLGCLLGIAVSTTVWLAIPNAGLAADNAPPTRQPVDFVNPFIGTGAHGHTYPGPGTPFGMVQLSPDTGIEGWDHCSGYHWADDAIMGFSHTHLSGCGCLDLGDVLFAPTIGKVLLDAGNPDKGQAGYSHKFSHANETAKAGYYSVNFDGIKAELTATDHVGVHRYTFPQTKDANIIIDLAHGVGDKNIASLIDIPDDHTVTGMRRSTGFAKDHTVYFAAKFSKPFSAFGTAGDDDKPASGTKEAKGTKVKGWLTFDTTDNQPIIAKVGISTVSTDGALRNLDKEVPDWDFDGVRNDARSAWNNELSKIQIDQNTADPKRLEVFYTALYHCMVSPQLLSDVDGQYRGSDLKVHRATNFKNYSNFSLWDTFRAEHPLLTILESARVNDIINAFLVQAEYEKDKTLPVIPLCGNETFCMIGYHSFPVIAEAYLKGIRNWDANRVFELMVQNSKKNDWWATKGYMPLDKEKESAAKTLEFAYDDWALAQFAKALGKDAEYHKFMKRAEAYRNVFDRRTGFMRGRASDGTWRTPFDPTNVRQHPRDFTEANAWQYSFFAPQDMQGLIALMGGREAFGKKLDQLFSTQSVHRPDDDLDITGLIGQYAHGNEPSHHIAYLYDYAGEPSKTQDRVREIRNSMYDTTPAGICGNEDCGQMSAWYVFSALGFYPVNPVQGTYLFGVPEFENTSIELPDGKQFTVVARGLSNEHPYIQSATLNGQPLERLYLKHGEIMGGGKLEFVMGAKPNLAWGANMDAVPPAMSVDLRTASVK